MTRARSQKQKSLQDPEGHQPMERQRSRFRAPTGHQRPPGRPARARPQAARSKRDRPARDTRVGVPKSATSAPPQAALILVEANSATHRL
jgi:hypothetical protein